MKRYMRQISLALPLLLTALAVTAGDPMPGKGDMMKDEMKTEGKMAAEMSASPMMEKGEMPATEMKMEKETMHPTEMKMDDAKEMDDMKKKDM